jgi:nucleoside phosphorylase
MREMLTNASRYQLAIVTALPKEFAAVEVMLDQHYDVAIPSDPVRYTVGTIGPYPVVVTLLPKMGNNPATAVSSNLLRSFPNMSDVIMVGIAGGVPNPENTGDHVRLGDIVVSMDAGVMQFDVGKFEQIVHDGEPVRKYFTIRASDPPPSSRLQQAVRVLEARRIRGERPWERYIARATVLENAARPSGMTDILYDSQDPNRIIPHPQDAMRIPEQPKLHYGLIGSSNMLLKEPGLRDRLRDEYKVRAIEMEGSGIATAAWMSGTAGYLLIRGICDYCDSHKNDAWQGYAAAVAAAYVRVLIETIPVKTAMSATTQSSTTQLNKLRRVLVDFFNMDELKLLCADVEQELRNDGINLRVNLDMIGGDGQEIRCLNLVAYLDRRGYLQYLVSAVCRARPGIDLLCS